ncbi:MAG: hypothetical protein E5W69_12045, partial [Mesorhizobium sp.]
MRLKCFSKLLFKAIHLLFKAIHAGMIVRRLPPQFLDLRHELGPLAIECGRIRRRRPADVAHLRSQLRQLRAIGGRVLP